MSRLPCMTSVRRMYGIGGLALLVTTCAHCPPTFESPRECPRSWTGFEVRWEEKPRAYVTFVIGSELSLAREITNVPEFHDCQRFINHASRGPQYDSLYAVFASRDLKTLGQDLDRLYGLPSLMSAPGGGTRAIGLPAAEIMSLGGTYPALGIMPGFNCLYFFRDSTELDNGVPVLKAKMHPVGPRERDCAKTVDVVPLYGKVLIVRKDTASGFTDDDFPPVARWDQDRNSDEHYIGIKCGPAWCEVGDTGFVSSPTYDRRDLPPRERRVHRIKGWYDEQILAQHFEGKTYPYGSLARIVPHPMLGTFTRDTFAGRWVHVATAIMPADPGHYAKKMNYEAGENRLYLCMGIPCGVPDSLQLIAQQKMSAKKLPLPDASEMFWAAIVSASGITRMTHVVRKDHSGLEDRLKLSIVATARWRWILDDETNWIRCDEGCCHPEPPPPP